MPRSIAALMAAASPKRKRRAGLVPRHDMLLRRGVKLAWRWQRLDDGGSAVHDRGLGVARIVGSACALLRVGQPMCWHVGGTL